MDDLTFEEGVDVKQLPLLMQYAYATEELAQIYTELRKAHKKISDMQEQLRGQGVDEVETYRVVYQCMKQEEGILKATKERLDTAKEGLFDYMRSQGVTAVTREGFSYSQSSRVFAKVNDYDAFLDWVTLQDEPHSEYLEQTVKKKPLTELVKEARISHPGREEEVLPDGIGFSMIEIITVREKKNNTVRSESAMGRLVDIAEDS